MRAEAHNLALRVLAYGGVYFAGDIVLKILTKLQAGAEYAVVLGAPYQALACTHGEGRHECTSPLHEVL